MKPKKRWNVSAKMDKKNRGWFIYFFSFLLVGSATFDAVTFIYSSTKAFEINPLYLLTGSVGLMVALKLLVMVGFVYVLFKKPKYEWTQYLFVSLATYLILLHIVGGISNIAVNSAQPPDTAILPQDQAVQAYNWTIIFQLYAPVLVSTLIFLFWQWCYPKRQNYGNKT